MLTKTIGQLSAATVINDVDLLEIEQAGVSKYGTASMLVTDRIATTAQSVLGTSNSVLMTPLQVREAFSANNDAPIYACRAWVTFDGTTTSSSLAGTYTRVVGTTQTVCVATSHGMITGNVQYIDFVTGGASDNTYIVTVVDPDTFTVDTVSTSSILTSTLSLKRCPVFGSGNIANVSRVTTGIYFINFATGMPNENYAWHFSTAATGGIPEIWHDTATAKTAQAILITTSNNAAANTDYTPNSAIFFG